MGFQALIPWAEADAQREQAQSTQWRDAQRQQTIVDYMRTAKNIRDQLSHVDNLHKALALTLDPNTHQPAAGHEQEAARLREQLGQFDVNALHGNLNQVESYMQKLYDPNFNFQTGMEGRSPLRALAEKMHLAKPQGSPLAQPQAGAAPQTAGELMKGLRSIQQKYDIAAPGIGTGEQELAGEEAQREQERTQQQRMDFIAAEGKKRGWSEEQIQEMQGTQLGLPKPTAARRPAEVQGTVTIDGKERPVVQQEDETGDITVKFLTGEKVPAEVVDTFKPTGKTGAAGKKTQYDEQLDVYLRGIGRTRETMTLQDQENFIKSRVPYGDEKLSMAQERMRLEQFRVDLTRSQQNFQDTMELQKQMTPMEKIQTGATLADGWVTNHSPQGDAALIFAFLDAVKTSGFRFNQAEQNWIVNARPFMEGLNQRYIQGLETGESLTPQQRQNMANIIKTAAGQVGERQSRILGAVAPFKPEAAAAARQITPTAGGESAVGTIMKGRGGIQYRKSKAGPDTDRNNWEQVPAGQTTAPTATPAKPPVTPAPQPAAQAKPTAGRRSLLSPGGHFVGEIVEYNNRQFRVTSVNAKGDVTGTETP